MTLEERLNKIRSSPLLQNQQQTAVVLGAVEDTLRNQGSECSPAAYFAALLSLLNLHVNSTKGISNKEVASAVVYLLDLVTPHVSSHLLRSKFSQILTSLATALTDPNAEAPLLRASIGCLESLLLAQESKGWALPQTDISPRRAVAGLLKIAVDHRPKVRKRAQDALSNILKTPPPSPSLDHPVADMCAESALYTLVEIVDASDKSKKHPSYRDEQFHAPGLIHALQLIKTIATACGGWPTRKIDPLCQILLKISQSSNEYLTMAAFEVFEVIFSGMADEVSSSKLPRLLGVISDLQPSKNDSQLLPPWIAVISRGYDVSAQVDPDETFRKLPELFDMIANFLTSPSYNIRTSAAECMISFIANCIPNNVLLDPSVAEERILEKLAKSGTDLLSVKYQMAWMEVFSILGAMFDGLCWRSAPILCTAIKAIGDLRANESFVGKKEADAVLAKAMRAVGPDVFLEILPLNLTTKISGQPGRAWLLPIMRDSISNAKITHFKSKLVPLSEEMFQKVLNHGSAEKTMEIKIYETIVQQIWSTLPGYCVLPTDLLEAFDQSFAEMIANLLYQQPELRVHLCRALQNLVDSNKSVASIAGEDDLIAQSRMTKLEAQKNLAHLAEFASNLLAVLFNVYSQTLPQYRGYILTCINAYLSITPSKVLIETFSRVTQSLEDSLSEPQILADTNKQKQPMEKMPPMSHTLMDLIITMSIYLPRDSLASLFKIANLTISLESDPQLQKKSYKLIPRLAESPIGKIAMEERNIELQKLFLDSTEKVSAPARRDRLAAISKIVEFLPTSDLHFIPSILPEVVITLKEVNERARIAAFDLLVSMGVKMRAGGTVINSNLSHMASDTPPVAATLEEYFTMVSAGLAGSTPHMISASVTALTRILYQFRSEVSEETIKNLQEIMDMFLQNPNREIVRSVLGFVKVSVTALPPHFIISRLQQLVPNLMIWGHEHKGHFRAKVKHIVERMIRRFGPEVIEQSCPEADKNLIRNIRKARERSKRKKREAVADETEPNVKQKKRSKFESEYDEAVYGSDTDSSGSDISDDEALGRKGRSSSKIHAQTYIHEDDQGDPLDLLDRRALANISTTKPLKKRTNSLSQSNKTLLNEDGKFIIDYRSGDEDEGDVDMIDFGPDGEPGDGTLEGGINAYVEAIRGRDAAQRGQRGKLKFSNRRSIDDDDEMDVDDEMEIGKKLKRSKEMRSPGSQNSKKPQGQFSNGRRPLGFQRAQERRIGKATKERKNGRRAPS